MTAETLVLRTAEATDIASMNALIHRSGIALSVGFYTPEQARAVTRYVFGVDTQLVRDGTYFVIEEDARLLACGGWGKRRTMFGSDQIERAPDPLLDPTAEAARLRAFFVDPEMARRGLAGALIERCFEAARSAGFHALELAATLPGEPFYSAHGFTTVGSFELTLPGPVVVPFKRMRRAL